MESRSRCLTRNNNAAYVAMENWTAPLELGCEIAGFQPFNGGLDEVRLWNVVRTQSEVQAAMLLDLTGTEPGLAAYWRFNEGTGTTVADDGPGNHIATLYNTATWMDGGPLATSGGDVTPPDITGVTTSNLTTSSVTISFTTSEVATGRVSYTGASCPCSRRVQRGDGHGARRHADRARPPDTTYQYQVKAVDGSGNLRTGPTLSFRTLAPAGDTTPPVVGITSPVAGTVAGTVQVQATATDNVGVVGVQFKVDGVNLGSEIATAPYGAVVGYDDGGRRFAHADGGGARRGQQHRDDLGRGDRPQHSAHDHPALRRIECGQRPHPGRGCRQP